MLYAEDFDDVDGERPAAARPPEPEVIEPVFTAAELDAARAEARQAGRRRPSTAWLPLRLTCWALLAAGMADAGAAAAQAEAAAAGVAATMLAALAACLPALCDAHGAAELRALARALLPALPDEPRITVRVNPHMLAAMQDEIAALDGELAERVRLLPTDAMPPGDARVTGRTGPRCATRGGRGRRSRKGWPSWACCEEEYADA